MASNTNGNNNVMPEIRRLTDIFEEGYNLYNSFDKRNDPTNSIEFQKTIKLCINLFEESTKLVSRYGMFSTNENFEEISTNDLKYLLLPYFLGQLVLKLSGEVDQRKNIVETAEIYFKDFQNRCMDYGFCDDKDDREVKKSSTEDDSQTDQNTNDDNKRDLDKLLNNAKQRNKKIEQYRKHKELNEQIKQLKIAMEREELDDEIIREFYVKLIKSSILDTAEELTNLQTEKEMLIYREKCKEDGIEQHKRKNTTVPILKPIIITKDELQKAVYGLGYPSLPTMTVAEFYDERVRDGIFPDPSKATTSNLSLQQRGEGAMKAHDEAEEIEKERQIENDDEEHLARARAMDEMKDDVRRGDGNRYNRS